MDRRAPQVGRLPGAIDYPVAWVSDRSAPRDFVSEVTDRGAIVRRVRRVYDVTLTPEDFERFLWQLVDEIERRPRA